MPLLTAHPRCTATTSAAAATGSASASTAERGISSRIEDVVVKEQIGHLCGALCELRVVDFECVRNAVEQMQFCGNLSPTSAVF